MVQLYKLTLSDGLAEFLSSPLSRLNFGGMILVLKKQNQVHVIRITSKPIRLISKPWWVVLNIKALCLHVAHCTTNLRNLWVRKRSVLPQKIIKTAFLCFLNFSVEWLALLKKNWILSLKNLMTHSKTNELSSLSLTTSLIREGILDRTLCSSNFWRFYQFLYPLTTTFWEDIF